MANMTLRLSLFIVFLGCGESFRSLEVSPTETTLLRGICRKNFVKKDAIPIKEKNQGKGIPKKWQVLSPEINNLEKETFERSISLTLRIDHQCLSGGKGGALSLNYSQISSHLVLDYRKEFRLDELESIEKLAEQDPCVEMVSNEISMELSSHSRDPYLSRQKHLMQLELEKVIDSFALLKSSPSQPIIAVIDSGIEQRHEDLAGVFWQNQDEIPGNNQDDDGNGYIDDHWGYDFAENSPDPRPKTDEHIHGTHVTGLIAANYGNGVGGSGLLPLPAKIMALNVFGRNKETSSSRVNNAIRYAVDNGANIINLSVGNCGYSAATGEALNYAVRKGVVVVAAAGNNGRSLSKKTKHANNCDKSDDSPIFHTPASFGGEIDGMLTVGSHDSLFPLRKSLFSNYGKKVVQIMAHGAEDSENGLGLLSTVPGGYSRLSGSSMSAPLVSASVALSMSLLTELGLGYEPEGIEYLLVKSSFKNKDFNDYVAKGKVLSLYRLVKKIEKLAPQEDESSEPQEPIPPCS